MPVRVKLTFKTLEGKSLDSGSLDELYFPEETSPNDVTQEMVVAEIEKELQKRKLFLEMTVRLFWLPFKCVTQ